MYISFVGKYYTKYINDTWLCVNWFWEARLQLLTRLPPSKIKYKYKMVQPKAPEVGESSKTAAQQQLKANANGVANYELPWLVWYLASRWWSNTNRVEKYRPVYLDDVVGNTETIERLKIIARDGNMPHVIISGMPGIGKTTSVLCLARQLLGDSYKEAVLELNASDERGTCRLLATENTCWYQHRYRRGAQPHQGFCTKESHLTARSTQVGHPRWSR